MRKRLGSILLALALALTLTPALGGSAQAQDATEVYVGVYDESGGSGPTWKNLAASENVGKAFYCAGHSGYVSYDGNGKLTLSNYTMTGNQYYYDSKENKAYGIFAKCDLTIEVSGTCRIEPTCDSAQARVTGIYSYFNLTIRNADNDEAAVLTVHTKKSAGAALALEAYGIACFDTLTVLNNVSGSITVNTTGDDAYTSNSADAKSFGAYAVNASFLSGTVNGRGGDADSAGGTDEVSYGLCGNKSFSVSGRAKVTGTAGKAYMSRGVDGGSQLTLSGFAELTGIGGEAPETADTSIGVSCSSAVCGGSARLTGIGGAADTLGVSDGVRVTGTSFELNGGTVTATGGSVSKNARSRGFDMWKGSLTMTGGKLICTGGDSACPPGFISTFGMNCGCFINVSGGELTAESGFGPSAVGMYLRKLDTATEPGFAVTGNGLATIRSHGGAIQADSDCANAAITASGYIRAGRDLYGDDAVTIANSCTAADLRGMCYVVLDSVTPEFIIGDNATYLELRDEDAILHYNVRLARGGVKCIIGAWYDADGRLLGTGVKRIEGFPGKITGGLFTAEKGAAEYKLFYLDGTSFTPFCAAWSSRG